MTTLRPDGKAMRALRVLGWHGGQMTLHGIWLKASGVDGDGVYFYSALARLCDLGYATRTSGRTLPATYSITDAGRAVLAADDKEEK